MDAVTAALKAGLTAKVAELNDLYDDAYAIAVPHDSAYLDDISDEELESEMLSLPNPTVIVHGGDVVPASGSGNNPDIGNEYTLQNALSVSLLFTAQTIRERTRMAMRYRRAVKEVLLPTDALVLADSDEPGTCVLAGEGYL
jgi:hypothetical protein